MSECAREALERGQVSPELLESLPKGRLHALREALENLHQEEMARRLVAAIERGHDRAELAYGYGDYYKWTTHDAVESGVQVVRQGHPSRPLTDLERRLLMRRARRRMADAKSRYARAARALPLPHGPHAETEDMRRDRRVFARLARFRQQIS